MIDDIRRDHPDVIFLAEAFTRPKVMYQLAKAGFSQSYTYFTWRNTKSELTTYLTELNSEPRRLVLPATFLRQHARYQSRFSAERAAFRLSHPRRPGRDAVGPVGDIQRLRALRRRARLAEERIRQQRKIRDPRLGLGPPWQYHCGNHRAEPHQTRESRAALASRPIV